MLNFLIAIGLIFGLMLAWLYVQYLARQYAEKHPEFGPVKQEGLGCGKHCGCKNGLCKN